MPGKFFTTEAALATSASMLRPAAGMSCTVTSRATSACQAVAAWLTRMTPPVVSEARKVMIATTATSARPEIELRGTSGVSKRIGGTAETRGAGVNSLREMSLVTMTSVVDVQPAVVQHQAARIVLIHQRDVVRGDDDGGAGFVEFDEKPEQPLPEARIDIAGRLVGEQQLRTRNNG